MVRHQHIFSKMLPRTHLEPMDLKIIIERPDWHPGRGRGISKRPKGQRGKDFYLGNLEKKKRLPNHFGYTVPACHMTASACHMNAQCTEPRASASRLPLLQLTHVLPVCRLTSGTCPSTAGPPQLPLALDAPPESFSWACLCV